MDNKMTGEIPTEIAQLPNLQELVLSTNRLTGDVPLALTTMANLNTLMIGDNLLNQDPTSVANGDQTGFVELQFQASTASMDINKE